MGETILSMNHITKRYPGVVALDDVSLQFEKGEVHALMGENGAGKSTLIKVLSGAIQNDEGNIVIDNQTYDKMTPFISKKHNIEVIYQEYNLIGTLSVAENICIEGGQRGNVNFTAMKKVTDDIFKPLGISIDAEEKVRNLTTAQQQLVEIAKAISKNAKIIVMDEPTAQLTVNEVEKLYEIIRSLKKKQVTIIYISHRMEELFTIADCVSVLRDGSYVTTVKTKDTDRQELIRLMVGRELKESYPKRDCIKEEISLEVKNLHGMKTHDVSFKVYKGEILGLSGLVGAGRTELVRTIFGADEKAGGSVNVNGTTVLIRSPKDAISHGIGLIPEDRKQQGCFLNMSIEWNNAIGNIRKLSNHGFVNEKKVKQQAEYYIEKLQIKTPSELQKAGNLSGGNQQKVVLAKVLATNSDIIFFDEPTRGIDVGARYEIYNLMCELVEQGKSIIMISSDMEELLGMSDRIIVIREGAISGELGKDEFSQERILEYASIE